QSCFSFHATKVEGLIMKLHILLTGGLKLGFLLIGVAGLLAVPASSAEPDRLLRAFLGVSSSPVRFSPPQDKKCCYLTIAKFKDGKFLGYADPLAPTIEPFLVVAALPNYEPDLG